MEVLKKYKSLICFYLLINLIVGLFITMSSYVHTPLFTAKAYMYYAVHFILMQFSLFGFIYLLTINKYVFYGLFLPLFFLLSVIGFWGFTQDISLSVGVIQASLQTQTDIVAGLISWQLIVYIILIFAVIFFLVKQYNKISVPKFNYVLLIISLLGFLTFFVTENKRGGTLKNRLPYTLYFESQKLYNKNKVRFESINENLIYNQDSIQVVFVLGESVRADHLQLNGYDRETTPKLSKRNNIISYPNAFTTNTYTGASVPQILSNASVFDDYKDEKKSLIDVLNKSKISTVWIGNQTPEKSYLPFIENSQKKFYIDPTHSEFSFNKELDEKMIPVAKKELKQSGNQFITIHMMGSHWWYENRYDERSRFFKPVIKSKYIPSNSPDEMINSYDNTIIYLDNFLNEIITYLEKNDTPTILFFVSDHGELLGEGGKWLHAQPGGEKAVRNPAVIVWYSDKFKNKYPQKIQHLHDNKNKYLPLDFFYHTILDTYEIQGLDLKEKLSLFRNFKFYQPAYSE